MVHIWVNSAVLLIAFAGMEFMAWFTHKYVMHGVLWQLHSDHHVPKHKGFFQRNDLFFLIFAIPGIICLMIGLPDFNPVFWSGLGITFYGFAYFLVHDIFIHQRFHFLRNTDNAYFRAIRKAHKMHHKHLGKTNGECFGMLWVPWKFFKEGKNGTK